MKVPYEFLARWNASGVLTGAHVIFQNVFTEGDVTHVGSMDAAMPVALGAEAGFPLNDILGSVQAGALAQCEQMASDHAAALQRLQADHAAALQALNAEKATLIEQHTAAMAEKDAQLAALQQELAARPPAPVAGVVTRRQAVQALIRAGIDDDVNEAIDAIADPIERKLMRSWFDDSQEFHRDQPELLAVAQRLGLTPQRLDELFALAKTL